MQQMNLIGSSCPALSCLLSLCACLSSLLYSQWLPVVEGVPRSISVPRGASQSAPRCRLIGSCILSFILRLEMGVSVYCFCTMPVGIASQKWFPESGNHSQDFRLSFLRDQLVNWSEAEREHKDGVHHPLDFLGSLGSIAVGPQLYVRLEDYATIQAAGSNISKQASCKERLGIAISVWSCGHRPCQLSKPHVFRAHVSGGNLKS